MMCGAPSPPCEADQEIQNICMEVKADAEVRSGRQFSEFTAITYAKQVVAGTNYFIKVKVGEDEHIHIFVHKRLPCHGGGHSLERIQHPKTAQEPIGYF